MKAKLITLITITLFITNSYATNYYWVGGAGNWSDINHWATTSGGSVLQSVVPSQNDDVFFDAGSGFTLTSKTVIVNVIANCHNMTWTGALNTPTITAGSTNLMNIYGSMTLQSGMAYKIDKTYFKSTFAGETITTNGTTVTGSIYFDGTNGGWTLQDDLTEAGLSGIYLYQGHLNTNSKTLNIPAFGDVGATASHSLTLGSSVITTNSGGWEYKHPLAILNAGTSHIKLNGSYGFTTKSGQVYYNTSCYKPLNGGFYTYQYNCDGVKVHRAIFYDNATFAGSAIFDTLVFSAGKKYTMSASNTNTITSAFTATASPCTGLIEIISGTAGTQSTLHFLGGSTASVNNSIIKDIRATGAIVPITAVSSFDLGNNTGFTFTPPVANNLYWVGGTGVWNDTNHWSFTSGGAGGACVPTPVDDVFFDANSGFTLASRTVSLTGVGHYCHNLTWTGALNTPTITAGSTNLMNIYGSMTLQSGMAYKINQTYFKSTFAGETITTNGTTVTGSIYFDGTNGGWTLQDDLTEEASSGILLYQGHLNTNSKTLNISAFGDVGATASHSLTLGSSVITTNSGGWEYKHPLAILNAGTSHIKLNGFYGFVTRSGQVYYNTSCYKPLNGGYYLYQYNCDGVKVHRAMFYDNATINGSAIFDTLVFSAGKKYKLTSANTQTIASAFTATAAPCSGLIEISSVTSGSQTTFHFLAGSVASISNALINDVRVTGAVAPLSVTNSFDLGNNTNITFTPAVGNNLYWVGGLGMWNDANHWSFTSGGAGGACVPTPVDDVFFDANSGFTLASRTVSLTGVGHYCHNMTWTGALNTPTITAGSTNLMNIYGSMTLQSGMAYKIDKTYFKSTFAGETITTNGTTVTGSIYFDGTNGGWTLQDDLTEAGLSGIYLYQGHLNTNSKTLNIPAFGDVGATASHSLTLGSSVITTNIGGWEYNHPLAILNAGTSHIKLNGSNGFTTKSGQVYYNTSCYKPLNGGYYAYQYNCDGVKVHRAIFYDNATFAGSAIFDTLVFSAGKTYNLQANTTQTITQQLYASGNPCYILFLKSSTAGTRANINVQAGSVNYDYTNVIDINATPSYAPLQMAGHSTDAGNNLNISFAPTLTTGIVGLGPDVTVCQSVLPLTLNTSQFYPNPTTTFTWTGGATTNTLSANTAGTYSIFVNYGAACTVTDNIVVTVPTTTLTASSSLICSGNTTTLTALGASSYTWSTSSNASSIVVNPTITTTYSVVGTTTTGCVANAVAVVTVTSGPTISIASVSNNSVCSGNNSIITPSGASTYTLLNTGATGTSFTVSPTASTTYSIVGTSASNCSSANQAQSLITVNTTPTVVISSVSNASVCSGNNSIITPSGASTYTLLNTGATGTSFTVSPTASTTYSIVGSSSSNCKSNNVAQTIITVNTTPTVSIATVSSASVCFGNNSLITPSGANTYTLLNTGATGTSFTVSPTASTTYSIIGTSSANCASANQAQALITVNATPTVAIASVSSSSVCSGNNSIITLSGASTYTLLNTGATGTSFTVSPTVSTTYSIVGASASNCKSNNVAQTIITVNTTPTITALAGNTGTICSGESFTITPAGGGTGSYTLTPGNLVTNSNFIVNPATSTTYTINGTNTSGCVSTLATDLNVFLTVNSTPTVNANFSSNALCASQNVTITLSGSNSSYTLNPGNTPIAASTASAVITPTAGTTIYTITATNTNGCVSSQSSQIYTTSVSVVTNPTISAAAITNSICLGNTASITPFGATSYTLEPGNQIISNGSTYTMNITVPTTYTINGTATGGCQSIASTQFVTTIGINPNPTVTATSAMGNNLCSGLSTTLSASGASSYTWSGGPSNMDYSVTPNTTTTYTLIGENSFGCNNSNAPTTLTINVLSTPTLALATSISSNTLCSGNSATITLGGASAGSTYTLLPDMITGTSSIVVTPIATTDYTVIATDNANGCVSTTSSQIYTTTVTVATSPTISLVSVSPSNTLCSGQSATLSVSGASTYTLINSNSSAEPFVLTPSVTTTYSFTGTGANGCVNLPNTDLVTTIMVNQTPTISLLSVAPSQTVCAGQSATITANGASSYTLINTNATASPFVVTPTVSTTYSIVGTSANGCVSDNASVLTLTIDIGSGILVSSSSTSVTCFGGNNGAITVSVTSASAYGYLWSNGMTTGAISNLTAGVYSLTVTDANNCKAFNTTTINEPNDIFITAQSNTPSCDNAPTGSIALNITGGTPSYAVLWSNGAVGSTVNNLPVGVITATITDNNACVKNHSETVSEEKCITTSIPNLLSPNGDGKNEPFFINTIDYFPNNKLEIYNRWGNLVYSKEKYDNTFNGKANVSNANGNGLLPAGTYFVIFEFGDDKTPTYKGYFDLKY